MKKTILITGSTDGIGLQTARTLVADGYNVLLHGRNVTKVAKVKEELGGDTESYVADLSNLSDVVRLATAVAEKHSKIDVLINNAGVYKVSPTITSDNLDVRFVVNTIAPYLLTTRLLPQLGAAGRVVNLSSAAQAPVNVDAMMNKSMISDGMAYAQSKLGITMWTRQLASEWGENGPMIVAVNPGSMLGSKMVKEAYGVNGGDLRIGADILIKAALSDEFANKSGAYFDNDGGFFSEPHPAALDREQCAHLVSVMDQIIKSVLRYS